MGKRRPLGKLAMACIVTWTMMATPAGAQTGGTEFRLALAECMRIALENNLELVSARKDPEIARHTVDWQEAAFDLQFSAGLFHSESEQEVFSISDITSRTFDGARATLTQQMRFGGDFTVELSSGRSDVQGALVTLDTSYGSTLGATLNLPLLRGFGKETTMEPVLLARGDLEISREELARRAELVVETAEGAYWDLVASRTALGVARQSLARARDLLDQNRKKVEVGTLAPIEITQAEAGVAAQEEGVIVAETALENAEDELRRLLGVPESDPLWSGRIVPTDRPSYVAPELELEQAIATALAERPEIAAARTSLRKKELSARVAHKALRPGLDLQLQVIPSGNNFIPTAGPDGVFGTFDDAPIAEGGLFESLQEVPEFESYDWSIGLSFSQPIGNRRAKAAYAAASADREKAEVDLRNEEQTVRVEVRRAVREVSSGIKRVEAARANVVLQRKKLEAEEKKYENGMSTSFEVLTFQNDLADAELSEVRARLDYARALTSLDRVQGRLLEARGLRIGP